MGAAASGQPLLAAYNLTKHFPAVRRRRFWPQAAHGSQAAVNQRGQDVVKAVQGVNLTVGVGETVGIVGESGSGKTTLARLLAGLLPPTAGQVMFAGQPLAGLDRRTHRRWRKDLQIVFQDPFAAFNPRFTVAESIAEPLLIHGLVRGGQMDQRVGQLLHQVGLTRRQGASYPYELSGGQLQRVGLARALASRPRLILCDEPTAGLDVATQAQIINLLAQLQVEYNLAYVLIAHDLSLVRHLSRRIGVMQRGKLVELAPGEVLFKNPQHDHTKALLQAIPDR